MSPDTPLLTLGGEAHLWLLQTDRSLPPERIATFRDFLSPDEAERYDRFTASRARRDFLLARGLARTTLSRYAAVEPVAWAFRENDHGRPEVDRPLQHRELRFNLSHTRGLVVCLVARGAEVGVDVERIGRVRHPVDLAARFFAPAEAAALRGLSGAELDARFCSFWALKESYIKARGVGIALGLRRFAFTISGDGSLQITFDPELGDREAEWQFALYRPTEQHRLAVAIRRGQGTNCPIRLRQVEPLTDDFQEIDLPLIATA